MSIQARNAAPVATGVIAWLVLSATPAPAQHTEGMFVTVPNPITSEALIRIQKQIDTRINDPNEARKVRTVVFDFNPDGKPASTAQPGICGDLTAYIRKIQGSVTTVAF